MKIMIVEDEKNIRTELSLLLRSASYEVIAIDEFKDVTGQVREVLPDLVLLDVKLPGTTGWEICERIRESMNVPIIFLTSDDEVSSEINGMLLGADDYISKPYHPSLLLARIAAVLKRSEGNQDEYIYEHKGVSLDIRTYKLTYNSNQVEVTKNECKLLTYMMTHKDIVMPRLDIVEYLWDNGVFIDDNALSVTVTRLRNKLEEIGAANFIETKRGVGYRI
ncbi:MAG: response regulator transcription factor [Suipraeoptans sp.]